MLFFIFQRRTGVIVLRAKKCASPFSAPKLVRNFSSAFTKYENPHSSTITLDNFRVCVSLKNIQDLRYFSTSIVKYQDMNTSLSEAVSAQIVEEIVTSAVNG